SAEMAVSLNGTLLYAPAGSDIPQRLVEIDRSGREYPLPHLAGHFILPRYSPDGRSVALSIARLSPGAPPAFDVWIYDRESPTARQLSTSHRAVSPGWTRDSRRIGWTEATLGLGAAAADMKTRNTFWRSADGSDSATSLVPGALATEFSPTADVVVCV